VPPPPPFVQRVNVPLFWKESALFHPCPFRIVPPSHFEVLPRSRTSSRVLTLSPFLHTFSKALLFITLGNLNTGQSSDASSETSSLSDHHRSTLSSAPSSSLVSLMEGSYVPASSLTDLGSDYWGSMASLRDVGGSQHSG
jgi:hypothetical protein